MSAKQNVKTNIKNVDNTDFTPILIAVVVVIVTLVIFLIYRRSKTARNGILLTGLCDSGKTLLFAQLCHRKFIQTQTSIKENVANYVCNNKSLKIIDIPGHERLREKFLEQYKSAARGIVFVIDSLTVQQDVRDTAEFLYNILVDPIVQSNRTNLLILCNKQDMSLSKGSNAIKSLLEKELNTLSLTKSRQLDSVDPKAKRAARLASGDQDFSFTSVDNLTVEFAEGCALNKNGDINIKDLEKWITRIA